MAPGEVSGVADAGLGEDACLGENGKVTRSISVCVSLDGTAVDTVGMSGDASSMLSSAAMSSSRSCG